MNYQSDGVYIKNGIAHFNNQTIVFLNEENKGLLASLNVNYIIVNKESLKLLGSLELTDKSNCAIIFDSSVKQYQVDYWKKRLEGSAVLSSVDKYIKL